MKTKKPQLLKDDKDIEKLKISCKILNEIRDMIKYWRFENVWPINLCIKGIEQTTQLVTEVIFNNDMTVSDSHIIDK